MPTTDEHAIAPSLEQLTGRFGPALSAAGKEANNRLDALLSKSGAPIRQVQANLQDREIKDVEELERVLDEIRTRVLEQLKAGCRVRLI